MSDPIKPGESKSEGMKAFLNAALPGGYQQGKCSMCGSKKMKPEDFKDDLSRREAGINNMCQECQDDVFG